MTALEQSMARDKQRLWMAIAFQILIVAWFAFIFLLVKSGIPMDMLGVFSLGTVTGSLFTIEALIFQFFFRASGDKPKEETNEGAK